MKHHNNDYMLIWPIHHTIYCDNNDSEKKESIAGHAHLIYSIKGKNVSDDHLSVYIYKSKV